MESKKKVLVSRQFVGDAIKKIKEQYEVREWLEDGPMPVEMLKEWIADCDGYYGVSDPMNEDVLNAAKKLRTISHVAAGTDNIDLSACTSRGISVGNTPEVLTNATADMTIALMLTFTRRIVDQIGLVKSGGWKMNFPTQLLGRDIYGKTLGIIGMGKVGKAVASRASAFGMKIIYYGRNVQEDVPPGLAVFTPLDQLLQTADIVSLHVPLLKQTQHLINISTLSLMKKESILINMARGPVVDSNALYKALCEGWIAGAALDVTDPEPIPADHPLFSLPNVIITPHAGSATWETRNAMALTALENLQLGLSGLHLKFCANLDVYT